MTSNIFILLVIPYLVSGELNVTPKINEDRRNELIVDMIQRNLKTNGWINMLCIGYFPDSFYKKSKKIPLSIVITNSHEDDYDIEDMVPYHSNIIILSCLDLEDFENNLLRVMGSTYWHPHSNIILYYHSTIDKQLKAKLFFILWYYKACNAVIIHYDDSEEMLFVSNYNPYISEHYKLDNSFGCWTARKIGMPIVGFDESFVCVEFCHNVTVHSKLRAKYLGTCLGFNTNKVSYGNQGYARSFNLFEDRAKNLHGFTLRAFATDLKPFLDIREDENGTFTLHSRDGTIWNTVSKLMNFSIDLSPSASVIKKPFNFEHSIQQIYAFSQRKGDLFLYPIYQFDIIILDIDYTFAYKESGVCLMSHRADFETILFNLKLLQNSYKLAIQFTVCFICIWLVFCLFNTVEMGRLTFDQAGRDLVNTVRNVLLISLHKPPKQASFRIFLTVSIWCFFVMSFASQAAIISFFTAMKRGKDVETFGDILEKGYDIEGMASPDVVLPTDDEMLRKISEKIVPISDMFGCVKQMSNDSHRFCLIDCSVGRFLEKNKLDEKGVQYLHIATDRIHSYYLNMIFPKYSELTDQFSKHMMTLFEAGLIKKWEDYRYNDVKGEAPIKALSLEDVQGIFNGYCMMVGFTCIIFLIEVVGGNENKIRKYCNLKFCNWNRARIAKKKLNEERKLGIIN